MSEAAKRLQSTHQIRPSWIIHQGTCGTCCGAEIHKSAASTCVQMSSLFSHRISSHDLLTHHTCPVAPYLPGASPRPSLQRPGLHTKALLNLATPPPTLAGSSPVPATRLLPESLGFSNSLLISWSQRGGSEVRHQGKGCRHQLLHFFNKLVRGTQTYFAKVIVGFIYKMWKRPS